MENRLDARVDKFDYVVLGTGLVECILASLVSIDQKKVLQIDREKFYGGESASLNGEQLFAKFMARGADSGDKKYFPAGLDDYRKYSVTLTPKFMMSNGQIVDILVHTKTNRYLAFKQIAKCYLYRGDKLIKVPSSETEALTSSILGIMEKRYLRKFLSYVNAQDIKSPSSIAEMHKKTAKDIFDKFGLSEKCQELVGHAMALYHDDSYLNKPVYELVVRIQLYFKSMLRYGGSPFIYPMYGLGDVPQAFSRLCALQNGTFMLDVKNPEVVFGPEGTVRGVRIDGELIECHGVISDPSYVPAFVRKTGDVIRAVCILNHSISKTDDAASLQIIIPQKQLGRRNDIYIAVLSSEHGACPEGFYVAVISTLKETDNPECEIQPALKILGSILHKFVWTTPLMEPLSDVEKKHLFVSRSYDPSSHIESVIEDINRIYMCVTGRALSLEEKEAVLERQSEEVGVDDEIYL